ncbi:MAG: 3-deoxy-D-manno-octulosonic acid transferase [Pyrinomonadaceae bacterium]
MSKNNIFFSSLSTMYLFYSLLLSLGFLLLLPRFLYDALRHGKYAAGFRQRLGELPQFDGRGKGQIIWLHCVSVGETQGARSFAEKLLKRYPSHKIVVSTTTLTGQRVARDVFKEVAALVFYFPFDWAWTVRRALDRIAPSLVLVMETELWPHFLRQCRSRGVPVAVINGRISEKSFRRYALVEFFMRRVLNDVTLAVMQAETDAARIEALGLPPARIKVSGNLKFDAQLDSGGHALPDELSARFNFKDERRPLIVAASTHAPEEKILLEAFRKIQLQLRANESNLLEPRLLVAPRHPERFNEVATLIQASNFSWTRRSYPASPRDADCETILLDTIGELPHVYSLATIVFVGGSLAPHGGHNILEPAAAGVPIVTGAHTHNFASITKTFLQREALLQLPAVGDEQAPDLLARVLIDLLQDTDKRCRLGANAFRALEDNRGASNRTLEFLKPLFEQREMP